MGCGQTYWSATISKRALNMHAAASRLSAGSSSQADSKEYVSRIADLDQRANVMFGVLSLMDKIIASLPRFLIIFSHNLITFLLRSIPFLGAPVALVVTCLVNAYYCFESVFDLIARKEGSKLKETWVDQALRQGGSRCLRLGNIFSRGGSHTLLGSVSMTYYVAQHSRWANAGDDRCLANGTMRIRAFPG